MILRKSFILFAFLFQYAIIFASHSNTDTLKVLFIGNSYSYFNSGPEIFEGLVKSIEPEKSIKVKLVSQGGMTLQTHWEDQIALEAIKSDNWDYVVLQEQSKLGQAIMIDYDIYFGETDLFFEYARKFDKEIRKIGAETVFFMTWSVRDRPNEQEILTYAYTQIAKELKAHLVPVGIVWSKLRENNQFSLYVPDGSHPSSHGSYLAMCTIMSSILDLNPMGLPGQIFGHKLSSSGLPSKNEEMLVNISQEEAEIIQRTVKETLDEYKNRNGYVPVKKPNPFYALPTLHKKDKMTLDNISGKWYGTTTYNQIYDGLILEISNAENNVMISLDLLSPDRMDKLTIIESVFSDDQLKLTFIDSMRNVRSYLNFSLQNNRLTGLSESFGGRIKLIKNWNLSREKTHHNIDLSILETLLTNFEHDSNDSNYVSIAINHYSQYSKLIGKTYLPSERSLNQKGYRHMRNNDMVQALNVLKLAMTIYPKSVNTYDSYAEALAIDNQIELAINVLNQAYALAKETQDENLGYIKSNLEKLKKRQKLERRPPPPPPIKH